MVRIRFIEYRNTECYFTYTFNKIKKLKFNVYTQVLYYVKSGKIGRIVNKMQYNAFTRFFLVIFLSQPIITINFFMRRKINELILHISYFLNTFFHSVYLFFIYAPIYYFKLLYNAHIYVECGGAHNNKINMHRIARVCFRFILLLFLKHFYSKSIIYAILTYSHSESFDVNFNQFQNSCRKLEYIL